MLRFAFMGGLVEPAVTRQFLEGLVEHAASYADELARHREAMGREVTLHGRLALESGIEGMRGLVRWAKRALERFRGDRSKAR